MTTTPPRAGDPEAARFTRRGISLIVVLVSAVGCAVGAWLTLLLAEHKEKMDLGELLTAVGAKAVPPILKSGLIELGAWTKAVINLLLDFGFSISAAEITIRIATWLSSLLILGAMWALAQLLTKVVGSSDAAPRDASEIVSPREPNGGARLGGQAVFAMTSLLVAMLAFVPEIMDEIAGSEHWSFDSVGFVGAGLVYSGTAIAIDAQVFDLKLLKALLEWLLAFFDRWLNRRIPKPEPILAAPDPATFLDDVVTKLGDVVRARPTIVCQARHTTADPRNGSLTPAGQAHARRLKDTFPDDAIDRWTKAVLAFEADGESRNAFILEPLSNIHFAFLAEAMSWVQDRGRGVLVVVPQAIAKNHFADIQTAFEGHCSDITQAVWTDIGDGGGRPKDEATIETVLVATDRSLQRRIVEREADAFAAVVERLGLIVVLDSHLFNLARLQLQLSILLRRTRASDIRVIAHAAPWRGMEGELAKLVAPTGKSGGMRLTMARPRAANLPTVVVNNCARARDALIAGYFSTLSNTSTGTTGRAYRIATALKELEPLPMLARIALRPPYAFPLKDMVLVDTGLRDAKRRWEQVGVRLIAADRAAAADEKSAITDVTPLLEQLFDTRTSAPDPDADARIVFVQDHANLIDVMTTVGAAANGRDRIALIASEHYPLRDFLIDHVVDGQFDIGIDHGAMPIAPRPANGLRELARHILAEMTSADGIPTADGKPLRGVSRSRATELFQQLSERRLAAANRLSPTRLGIKRLLEMEFGGTFDVRSEQLHTAITPPPRLGAPQPVDDDTVFVCTNAEERIAAASSLSRVTLGGQTGRPITHLPADDHGLAYVVGTTLVIDEGAYVVRRVERDRIDVDFDNDPTSGNAGPDAMVRAVFCRLYDIDLTDPSVVMVPGESGGRSPANVAIRYLRLFAPIRRLTHATIAESSLAADRNGPSSAPIPLATERRVTRLRRVGRSVVIRFERPPSPILDDVERVAAEIATARLAFTLQVTLADMLFSLFPRVAHRLAVVSPQAAPVFARLDLDPTPAAAHLAARYPRLTALDAEYRPTEDSAYAARVADVLRRLNDRTWVGEGKSNDRVDAIDLIVIEDWAGDLGVCQAIVDVRGQIHRLWRDYLTWCEAGRDLPDAFYRFGADRLLDDFVFGEAADLLPKAH